MKARKIVFWSATIYVTLFLTIAAAVAILSGLPTIPVILTAVAIWIAGILFRRWVQQIGEDNSN